MPAGAGGARPRAKTCPSRRGGPGRSYFVAWEDGRIDPDDYLQVYGVLTDNNGAKLSEVLVPDPQTGDANWPRMATRGSNIAAVYYQYRQGNDPRVYFSWLDAQGNHVPIANGMAGGDVLLSNTAPSQDARFPTVQLAGTDFGVAWTDTRNGQPEVYFAKVTCP